MKTENCELTNINECDTHYQVSYVHHCDNCGYTDTKEHTFCYVMKNGLTGNIDNWHCPKCGYLCETKISYDFS